MVLDLSAFLFQRFSQKCNSLKYNNGKLRVAVLGFSFYKLSAYREAVDISMSLRTPKSPDYCDNIS